MATLGEMLRDAREARGISLADAERETKIRQKHISAIEDDKLALLPGPVFARGFLRNYAAYLGLDPDEVLDIFDQQTQPTRQKIRAARGEPVKPKGRKGDKISINPLSPEPIDTRVRYASSYIAISLLALPLIIAFYFVYSAYAGRDTSAPIPTTQVRPPTVTPLKTIPVIVGAPGSGDANTPTVYVPATPGTASETAASPTAAPTAPIEARESIEVSITTSRDAWMRVLVDGVQQYSGTIAKGQTRQWKGKASIRIRTGRADSVKVVVNGTDRGFLGDRDNLIVEKEWDRSGKERTIR